MSRIDPRLLDGKERAYYLDLLWSSIAELNSREEIKNFFKDLLSESESVMLARRIAIAKLLLANATYDEIIENLKTSPSTVAQVDRWLTSGFGGYERALGRLERARSKRRKGKKVPAEPYSFEWLKEKYPLHFALFNLLKEEGKE